MHKLLLALVIVTLPATAVLASDREDVMVTVNLFVDGFNKGDTKTALATCAAEAAIIDEFPPYEWHGPGACSNWADDYDANAKKNAITDGIVTLGKPRHVDISEGHAYVIVPASYKFKKNGKPVKERGATFTLTLQKGAAGWRITGWSWARP